MRLDPMTTGVIVILIVVNIILCIAIVAMKFGSDTPADITVPTVGIDDITLPPPEHTVENTSDKDIYSDYTTIKVSRSQLTQGSLVLANITHPYEKTDGELKNLYSDPDRRYTVATSSLTLLADAYDALDKMTEDYCTAEGKKSFCNLQVTAAYRTVEEQQDYYDRQVTDPGDEQYCEKPGYSDHHTGLAFDVKIYDASDEVSMSYANNSETHAKWIVDNHASYGFIMRFPADKFEYTGVYEGNHFRYVGVPHSVYMTQNNVCLDEYISSLKNYTLKKGTLQIPCGDDTYTVYYTAASDGDITEVHVPSGKEYSISGDNNGGYVVWFKN